MPKRTLRRGGKKSASRGKKQKIYNMKGCSKSKSKTKKLKGGSQGCGPYGCPIPAFSWKQMQQRGGSCSTCGSSILGGSSQLMKGGSDSFYKPPTDMPGPFIGDSWTSSIKTWPGVDGVSGNHNYLENNLYNKGDIQTMMQIAGKRRKKLTKGGGLMPQDLSTFKEGITYNLSSISNTLNGYKPPVSPYPYQDQLSSSVASNKLII